MADLLNWLEPSLYKRRQNQDGGPTLLTTLRTQSAAQNVANSARNVNQNLGNRFNGVVNSFQQNNEQFQQQAEQRRQQEEQQRQQRLEQMRQQQEQRQQQETAKRLQQQQAQKQQQDNLLRSSLNGGSLLSNLRDNKLDINKNNSFTNKLQGNITATASSNIGQKTEAPRPNIDENSWKRYYNEEQRKVRDEAFKNDGFGSWLQDTFNAGWDRRLAENRARTRNANELINQAWDDNGKVINQKAVSSAKKAAEEGLNTSRQFNEQERTNSRAIGASADSDYKDNRFLATFNAIRNMDVGNSAFGDKDPDNFDLSDAGRFVTNLLPGLFSAPINGTINLTEAAAGKGLDKETGNMKELDSAERAGRALSGAIDMAGVFYGGSGELLNSIGKSIFNKGASELAKQAVKNTTKDVIRGYLNAMIKEGAEEGVQQAFEFFGDGGKLITKDGEFDADSFKQMLQESGQAAGLGAIGGGMFHAGSRAINAANNMRINGNNSNIDTATPNLNNNLIGAPKAGVATETTEINTRNNGITPEQVQTTNDGTMVKTNADGTTSQLTDDELANVIEQSEPTQNTQQPTVSGLNPFQTNSINIKAGSEDINALAKRAAQGDTYAKQRLAELTNQNQEETTDWRGKNVDEVINPEENNNPLTQETQDETDLDTQQANQAEPQNTTDNLENRTFDELTPAEQATWLEQNDEQAPSEVELAQALRQMNIDPTGMTRLDMLREYTKALKNTTTQITPAAEISNTPEILPSERAIAQSEKESSNLLQELSKLWGGEEPAMEAQKAQESKYDEATSLQKINSVLEGKTSFEDYIGDQRELLWKSFKESNRGTETFYHQDPTTEQIDGRHAVSNNGTLYRDLYAEYGGRPTKAEFNEALDDVLEKGENSKYFDGFRELNHSGDRAIFDFNRGNEDIETILALQKDAQWVRQPSKNSSEVANIQEVLMNDGSNMRKFTTVLKGVSNRVANIVKEAIGLDVRSYDHTIDNYAAQHAINGHKNDKIPLKVSDFKLLPDIIKNPDSVEYSKKNGGAIVYKKQYNDRIVYLEEVREKRHELAMKTMYWQEAQKNSTTDSANPHLISDTDSLRALSRQREGANEFSIAQPAENVNQNSSRSYDSESEKLPDDFDAKHYVSDQVKAQRNRGKLPLKERISDATAELKHYLVDDAVAYERYIKDKNERLNIREGVDRVRSSDMIAKQYMEDHGLKELGKLSDEDMNEFQQYLIAKRALEVTKQGKKTGRSKLADQALIAKVGNKYAKEEAIVRQYTKGMLQYSADNGLISQKLKDDLIKNNPNYVPMNRVFEVVENKTSFKSKQLGNLSKQTVVQRMEGSERAIENPIESLMVNTMRMINEAERNKTAKLIADSKAFHEKVLTEDEKPRPGYDKLSYMVNGEKVSYEVPKLVAKEMKNLNNVLPQAAENVLNVIGAPTKWLRAGATQNNPIFAISNFARDQMQTWVTGSVKANAKGTKDAILATFSPGKKGNDLRAELNRAGIIGNEYRQTYGYKQGELVKQLQNSAKLDKRAAERFKHPINALADLVGKTEYFTRAQQYFGTDGNTTTKAQAARNNTLNFGRAGATTRILNRVIPFLNAGVQGGRITVKSFKERPVHSTLAFASLAGLALAAKAAAEAQDKDLWDRIDDSDKEQNIIILTPDAHYDPDSNRVEGIVKIPVAQMLYPMMDGVNNLKGTPEDVATLAGDIFTATTGLETPSEQKGLLPVINQLTPTAAKPFVELAMNKSTYTGNDIVSEYDKNKDPEDKGAKYTTGLARTIAQTTGIDAPTVDNFIQNWGGGLAKDLSKTMTDNPDNKKDAGGIAGMLGGGFERRFLSGTVTSQYDIADGLAKNYKKEVKSNTTFNSLSDEDKEKVLNAIDSDMTAIAGIAAKTEQGRDEEIKSNLSKRQTELVNNGFDADSYIASVTDKKRVYAGNGDSGSVKTMNGDLSNYNKTTDGNNTISAHDSLSQEAKSIIDKHNSMSSEDWKKYINGTSAESAAAEYKLVKAKYENDLANGKISDTQKIKREKELTKLEVSQKWSKNYRDAYGLAGSKADMQAYLNGLDDKTKSETVAVLNGLNNAMYEAGIIKTSTYKTRANAINNTISKKSSGRRRGGSKSGSKSGKSGMTAAEASALSSLAKTMSDTDNNVKIHTPKAPNTKRKMSKTRSSGNKTNLATYTPSSKKLTVTKGLKKSIT